MKKNSPKSIFTLFLAAIIWGIAFVAQTDAAETGIGAFTFNGTRFVLGSLALIPVIMIFEREKLTKSMLKNIVFPACITGTILFIASSMQQFGIEMTGSASKSSFITGLYMVLVPIFAFVFLKRKISWSVWLGAIVAVVGLYLLSIKQGEALEWGDALLLIATIFWASHILTVDKFIVNASPLKFSAVQMFVCGMLGIICALLFETWDWNAMAESTGAILYTGLLSSGVAYTCQLIGQKGTTPTVSTMILSTEAVFGALAGVVFNNEILSVRMIIGCVMMFVGIILAQLEIGPKSKKTA